MSKKRNTIKWEQRGTCLKCGCPIFIKLDSLSEDIPPQAVYTCGCRFHNVNPTPATTPFIPYTPAPIQPYGGSGTGDVWRLPETIIQSGARTVTCNNKFVTAVSLLQENIHTTPTESD